MIRIGEPQVPFEIPLPGGVVLTAQPVTTASLEAARAAARRRQAALKAQLAEMQESGLPVPDELAALDDPAESTGRFFVLLAQELAVRHVTAWQGVETQDGMPAPLNRENLCALMALHPYGERTHDALTLRPALLAAAKNACAPSAAGTSSPTEGAPIAPGAAVPVSPAPTAAPAPEDGAARTTSMPG